MSSKSGLHDALQAVQTKGSLPCLIEPSEEESVVVMPSLAPVVDASLSRVLAIMQARSVPMSQRELLAQRG